MLKGSLSVAFIGHFVWSSSAPMALCTYYTLEESSFLNFCSAFFISMGPGPHLYLQQSAGYLVPECTLTSLNRIVEESSFPTYRLILLPRYLQPTSIVFFIIVLNMIWVYIASVLLDVFPSYTYSMNLSPFSVVTFGIDWEESSFPLIEHLILLISLMSLSLFNPHLEESSFPYVSSCNFSRSLLICVYVCVYELIYHYCSSFCFHSMKLPRLYLIGR